MTDMEVEKSPVFLQIELQQEEAKEGLQQLIQDCEDRFGMNIRKLASDRVKLRLDPEEIHRRRRAYRKNYRKRPDVIERNKLRYNDPKNVAKRKEYASDPEVKQRKKLLAKRRRLAFSLFAEENRSMANNYLERAESMLT